MTSTSTEMNWDLTSTLRNPTLEEQALARIHRLGQTKEVTTVRFFMRDSFEEVSHDISREIHISNRTTGSHQSPRFKETARKRAIVISRR